MLILPTRREAIRQDVQLPNENKGTLSPAGPSRLNGMLFGSKVTCSSLGALQEAIVVVVSSAKVTITYPHLRSLSYFSELFRAFPHFCYTHQYWQNLFNLTEAFYLPLDFLHLP